ncbi:hypothetical protein [Cytobacillus firmus]|uniref:Uncharacterized protein n=1 Tax=Cytobacillus firmus TaxID=1399 RepID=A0AA46SH23_CYTFI|nr:hypothetical protein [Cytobacillus firmus]UYG93215.1 hypothetical protein OD459_13050 [Cytobacillus firmus]
METRKIDIKVKIIGLEKLQQLVEEIENLDLSLEINAVEEE